MNGTPNGAGEVVVKVNTTYLRLFQTIAAGIIALIATVGAFIIRVEVNAATMHSDVTNMLEKIAASQAAIARNQEAIKALDNRVWDLKIQVAENQAAAEGQGKEIKRGLSEVKNVVEEKIPEPLR